MNTGTLVFLVIALVYAVERATSACKDLKPKQGFTKELVEGKYYSLFQKTPYANAGYVNCFTTYTFIEKNTYTFFSVFKNKEGTENYLKEVGLMDPPGHWLVSSSYQNGTDFTFPFTLLGWKKNEWLLFYSCDQQSGDYGVWLAHRIRLPGDHLDEETTNEITEVLKTNGLSWDGFDPMDNKNCTC